jgi:hypothetical protein
MAAKYHRDDLFVILDLFRGAIREHMALMEGNNPVRI